MLPSYLSLVSDMTNSANSHRFLERFFVNRHLDRDVRKIVIDTFVRFGGYCTVVLAVLMELGNRTNHEGQVGDNLQREELEYSVSTRNVSL